MKRIIICADGTWNRPEKDTGKDFPSNVLRIARAIKSKAQDGTRQVVFYDWGVGSYYKKLSGGIGGKGLNKNIRDCYRFIVQNYEPGDQLFFFGFSRGAYTVRSLAGFIYNCGILKKEHASLIFDAFRLYKKRTVKPRDADSVTFRNQYSHQNSQETTFVGVWDTVGNLGIPFSIAKALNKKHQFHDTRIGEHIHHARQAIAIDEKRIDFKPCIWSDTNKTDLVQCWFAGVHSDVGGSYPPDKKGTFLSDIPLKWMINQVKPFQLEFESFLEPTIIINELSKKHRSRREIWMLRGTFIRKLPDYTFVSNAVKKRSKQKGYLPTNLKKFISKHQWNRVLPI